MKYVQTVFFVIDLLGETYRIPRLSASALINQLIQTGDRKLLSSKWQIVLVELVFICYIYARELAYISKPEFTPLFFNIKGFLYTVSFYNCACAYLQARDTCIGFLFCFVVLNMFYCGKTITENASWCLLRTTERQSSKQPKQQWGRCNKRLRATLAKRFWSFL